MGTNVPRELTPVAISAGLDALDDPVTKERVARLLESPGTRRIERALVAGVVDGSVAALGEPARAAQIRGLGARYAAGLVRGVSSELGPRLASGVAQASRGAIAGVMSEATSDENRRKMTALVGSLAEAGVEPIREGLGKTLDDGELARSLDATARRMGRELVLGANDALEEIQAKKPPDTSLLTRLGDVAGKASTAASSFGWVLGLIAAVLAAWVVKLLMEARRYREESEQRSAASRLVSEVRRASAGKPWSEDLLHAIEEQVRADEEERRRRTGDRKPLWRKATRAGKNGLPS